MPSNRAAIAAPELQPQEEAMMRTVAICFGLTVAIACGGCGDGAKTQTKKSRTPTNRMAKRHAAMRNPSKDFSGAKPVSGLLDKLKSQDPKTKIQACKDLGKIGHDAKFAVRSLGKMAKEDSNAQVRSAASSAIEQIIQSMKDANYPDIAIEVKRREASGD